MRPNKPLAEIGTVTEREIYVDVCAECLCVIKLGLCSYDCHLDAALNRPEKVIRRWYKRVDTLIRSERL